MKLNLKTDYTTTNLVSQANAESQLRISSGYDSANVLTKLDAARQKLEADTSRSILNTVWTLKLDYFPSVITLPQGTLVSVDSVKYLDSDNAEQTLVADTDYYVSGVGYDNGRIVPVLSWPTITDNKKNAVEVEFTAGLGASSNSKTSWAESAILSILPFFYDGSIDSLDVYRELIKKHILYFDYAINE